MALAYLDRAFRWPYCTILLVRLRNVLCYLSDVIDLLIETLISTFFLLLLPHDLQEPAGTQWLDLSPNSRSGPCSWYRYSVKVLQLLQLLCVSAWGWSIPYFYVRSGQRFAVRNGAYALLDEFCSPPWLCMGHDSSPYAWFCFYARWSVTFSYSM